MLRLRVVDVLHDGTGYGQPAASGLEDEGTKVRSGDTRQHAYRRGLMSWKTTTRMM
jgi:hypothetical protein